MSTNLLAITAKMDIGVSGVRLTLEGIHDDLAYLIKNASTFTVQEPTRHALNTSDIILFSEKGLGFIERPLVTKPDTEEVEEDCGCNKPNGPLVPVEVFDSTFESITQASDEMYSILFPDGPIKSELGYVDFTLEPSVPLDEVEEGIEVIYNTYLEGTLSQVDAFADSGAFVILEFKVSDYVKSILGVHAVENPDEYVFTLEGYDKVINYTAKTLYESMTVNGKFYVLVKIGVLGAQPSNIAIKTNWGVGSNPKFKYTEKLIDTSRVLIVERETEGDAPLSPPVEDTTEP